MTIQDRDRRDAGSALLHMESHPAIAVLLTCLIMAAMVWCVYFLQIPNPNMILIAGLVVCSALFGYPGGITAGVFMFVYTLFFFSTDHNFVTFDQQNLQKVFVSLVGILVDLFFVCHLKRSERRAFYRLREANTLLHEDNLLLERASLVDQLTSLHNRFALRRDYPEFAGQRVLVLILDLDEFKSINDDHGHDAGDRCLQETGRQLRQRFAGAHTYRFGGDEFLVIAPADRQTEFLAQAKDLIQSPPIVPLGDGQTAPLQFSGGYVLGTCQYDDDLRKMFKLADTYLYQAKGAGKAQLQGGKYGL